MRPHPAFRPLLVATLLGLPAAAALAAPIQIYGVWHAGNDYCIWGAVRDVTEFDQNNHWIIDRGDGTPSVNLVILSFVEPLKLLHKTTDTETLDGIPRGMTQEIVDYFTAHGVRVMLSIGGITYVDEWDAALAEDPAQLGRNAAEAASRLGVGVEIDYEGNAATSIDGLQSFIDVYRSQHPYDAGGVDPTARLTIDLAAGDRWLIDLTERATRAWLDTANPVLDYANAMVPARQPSASGAIANWQEHVDGKPQYAPPILPLAPCKFTGGLYLTGRVMSPECGDFLQSVCYATRDFVQTVAPNGAGTSSGMLGYMFWAAECEGTRTLCTTPPNTCENGLGAGATFFDIPIPMPALRQDGATVDAATLRQRPLSLSAAAPNPSLRAAYVDFTIPEPGAITLAVYDASGARVRTLARGTWAAGHHRIGWAGDDDFGGGVLPGVYFARLAFGGESVTTKLVRAH